MAKVNGEDIMGKLVEKSNMKIVNKQVENSIKIINEQNIDSIENVKVTNEQDEKNSKSVKVTNEQDEKNSKNIKVTNKKDENNMNVVKNNKVNLGANIIKSETILDDMGEGNMRLSDNNEFLANYMELLGMAHKTREYKMIYAMEVYANDDFVYEYGLRPILKHRPAAKPRGKAIFYYAVCKHKTGAIDFKVLPREIFMNNLIQEENFKEKDTKNLSENDLDIIAKNMVLRTIINNNGGLK